MDASPRGPSAGKEGDPPSDAAPPGADLAWAAVDAGRPPEIRYADAETIARLLTRMIWDEPSDSSVLARLRTQPLAPPALRTLAEDMLVDPRARKGVRAFFRWWLLLEALSTLEKEDPEKILDAELRTAMGEEAPALGVHLTLEVAGTFEELLTAPFTFADERLARHYGVATVKGADMRQMPYPAGQNRVGVLTGAGLLTLFSSLSGPSWPAKRSWLVTDPVLCFTPPRTFIPPPPLDPSRSLREQMIEVTKATSCVGCHKLLNSPGFAFIGFDGFGRWRPEQGHGPDETRGWIPQEILPDAPTFDGVAELARLLAGRDEARRCFVRQWLQYAVDRTGTAGVRGNGLLDSSVPTAFAAFARSGFRLREAMLAVVETPAFAAP